MEPSSGLIRAPRPNSRCTGDAHSPSNHSELALPPRRSRPPLRSIRRLIAPTGLFTPPTSVLRLAPSKTTELPATLRGRRTRRAKYKPRWDGEGHLTWGVSTSSSRNRRSQADVATTRCGEDDGSSRHMAYVSAPELRSRR